MGHIELDFIVNAPIEQVWQFGLQAARIPDWQFDVVEVRGIDGPIAGRGLAALHSSSIQQHNHRPNQKNSHIRRGNGCSRNS